MRLPAARRPVLNLALQGGGAHGAFTWGVLDALLADGGVDFEGVSGASAGAMNAVCLAHGLRSGGREGARAALRKFWMAVAENSPFDQDSGAHPDHPPRLSPAMKAMFRLTDYFSPRQLNPFDFNPLRDIVATQIDFAGLRAASPLKLFISATHANSGKLRILREDEISLAGVLASACLPSLHHTAELDGEPYWDGGFSANPAIYPLCFDCRAGDILLILLSPLNYHSTPHSANDIRRRLQDIAFNTAFLREMRLFADLQARLPPRWRCFSRLDRRLADTRFHLINDEVKLGRLPHETRLTATAAFFEFLFRLGREQGEAWLAKYRPAIGERSTIDPGQHF